jgi:hypothetical protein
VKTRVVAIVTIVALIAIPIVAAIAADGGGEAAAPPTPTATSSDVPSEGRPEEPTTLTPELEPYDYLKAAPPREETPIDGFFLRILTLEETGGPEVGQGLPVHCLRCVPYSVDAGVQTLLLYEGRYYLEHQINGFRAIGHYEVDGHRVTFFNDANCSRVRGTYRWFLGGGDLVLALIDDPCPYVDERSHDFTLAPWTQVNPCASGVDHWYPGRLGCG